MKSPLKSRKFWIAVIGAGLLIVEEGLGINLPSETITAFAAVILGYILGETTIDITRIIRAK